MRNFGKIQVQAVLCIDSMGHDHRCLDERDHVHCRVLLPTGTPQTPGEESRAGLTFAFHRAVLAEGQTVASGKEPIWVSKGFRLSADLEV